MTGHASAARLTASTTLAALAGLHLAWAAGTHWPAGSRRRLAQLTAGTDRMPGAVPCVAVAGALGTAAALVAGAGGERPAAVRGRRLVGAALLARGLAGVSGGTARLVSWTPSPEFVSRDRRCYGPFCLALGAAVFGGDR